MENPENLATQLGSPSLKRKANSEDTTSEKDANCSYTAMIAQAIMRTPYKRATLSEIYNFMSNAFDILKKRGNGWRNCVRHTLSLNECFVKLNRPENGRSCNWTVHPSYFEAFMRGDYRKRRTNRKKARNAPQWSDERYINYQSPNPSTVLSYLPPSVGPHQDMIPPHHSGVDRIAQQQTTPPPTVPPASHSMWHSYVSSLEHDTPPSKPLNAHDYGGAYATYHHNMYGGNEPLQHKPLSSSVSSSNLQLHSFPQIPAYSNTTPPNEFNEHTSPNNSLDGSSHTERYTRYNRQYMNSTFPTYSKMSMSGGERNPYELNRGGERGSYGCSSMYGLNETLPPPFHESTCYGNLTNRSYRTEYF